MEITPEFMAAVKNAYPLSARKKDKGNGLYDPDTVDIGMMARNKDAMLGTYLKVGAEANISPKRILELTSKGPSGIRTLRAEAERLENRKNVYIQHKNLQRLNK